MNKIYGSLLILSFVVACQSDGCNRSTDRPISKDNPIGKGLDIDQIVAKKGRIITSACEIIPTEVIAKILEVNVQDLRIQDSSPREGGSHSSCFFKFDDPSVASAGILLQIMKNPVEAEYPNYVTKYIEAKRDFGEQTVEGEIEKFKVFEGFGDDGSYSSEAGKYSWRLGNTVIMSVAFNTAHGPEQQYKIASQLAREMITNYIKE